MVRVTGFGLKETDRGAFACEGSRRGVVSAVAVAESVWSSIFSVLCPGLKLFSSCLMQGS